MTINYIEIIKRSPYYYQVDGSVLEEHLPTTTIHCNTIWKTWKNNLPLYYEKEKIFLEMVQIEEENPWTFPQMLQHYSLQDELEFFRKNHMIIKEIFHEKDKDLLVPRQEFWNRIQKERFPRESVPFFFLRLALGLYKNDWTATTTCFRHLCMGKIMLSVEKPSCFLQGTSVWTNHGIKPIEKIQIGDQVATHNGRFSSVLQCFQNNRHHRSLYHVYTLHGKVAIATEDHPFLVYSQEFHQIVWKTVCDLNRHDFLLKATLHTITTCSSSGWFRNKHPSLYKLLSSFPRMAGNIMEKVVREQHDIEEEQYRFFNKLPVRLQVWRWVLETNQTIFVKGWMECFSTRTMFSTRQEAEMVMMVLNLFHYPMKLQKSCFFNKWYLKRKISCWQQNVLFREDKLFVRFFGKIKCSPQVHENNPIVYTLMVENDHSYNVNGYIVKNCKGLTPNTIIMGKEGLVPIYQLKKGDYVLDKDMKPVPVFDIQNYPYEGKVVSIYDCVHTISTPVYTNNQTICAIEEIDNNLYSPSHCSYYNPEIDNQFSMAHVNFLLRYICDWDIQQETDCWYRWKISKSDKLWIMPLFQQFYSFQYNLEQDNVHVYRNVLDKFVQTLMEKLLFLSHDKLTYFSSYLDRYPTYLSMNPYCYSIYCFLKQEKVVKQQEYKGIIYNVEIQGSSFCTTQSVIHKKIKTTLDNLHHWENISELYVPDVLFHGASDPRWETITSSQWKTGKPSLVLIDSHRNECVSGDTRILTNQGVVTISSKKDEMVSVWNGKEFQNVMIQQTGEEKKFLKIFFSNGMCLTCTPYHKFFIKSSCHDQPEKINASEIQCGQKIMSFHLPTLSMTQLPSSILMTLDWIAKRCIFLEETLVLFDKDIESLRDILLDLQFCGIKSDIFFNSFRKEYELRFPKSRWKSISYPLQQPFNNHSNPTPLEGDVVDDLVVVKINESSSFQPSYCFHEPLLGIAIFEGVATGQCENIPVLQYVKGSIDLTQFLIENPSKKKLSRHHIQIYTTKNCGFSQLAQREYPVMEPIDITLCPEEWDMKRHIHALSTVPAIFVDNLYVGDFMDFWRNYLCPLLDWEKLGESVSFLCHLLDEWMDKQKVLSSTHRPLVLEIYGFPQVLVKMKLSMEDPTTKQIHSLLLKKIEHIMLTVSNQQSIEKGNYFSKKQDLPPLQDEEELWKSICQYGLRNTISFHIMERQEMNLLSCFYHDLKQELVIFSPPCNQQLLDKIFSSNSIQDLNIPNSIKKIYQNQYELEPTVRYELIKTRRPYDQVENVFHFYVSPTMDQETLRTLQYNAWEDGFYKIKIHKKNL